MFDSRVIDSSITKQFERLPPHALEAEMCLIGSLLLSGGERALVAEVRATVAEGDFFQADHAIMFRVICAMVDGQKPVDGMTFRDELTRRQMLEEVGGLEYLASILNAVPHYAHAVQYARTVREKARLRSLISMASDLLRECYAPSDDDNAVALSRKFADKAAEIAATGSTDPVTTLYEAAARVIFRRDEPTARRIRTLIESLDRVIGGLAKGKFTLVGADPRVGKSALIKQILRNIAMGRADVAPVRCGLVTIEEDEGKVAENMLANASGIANHRIAHGSLSAGEWDALNRAAGGFEHQPYFIDDAQSKLEDVVAAVERLATKYRCEVVAVDHLHLIACDAQTREREVSKISKALKAVFKRCNVAGIVACQLNRGADARQKPQLRNLRDSGSLEADGDCILLLYREDVVKYQDDGYVPTRTLEVNIAKNKDGAMGEIPLSFDGPTQFVGDPEQTDPFA